VLRSVSESTIQHTTHAKPAVDRHLTTTTPTSRCNSYMASTPPILTPELQKPVTAMQPATGTAADQQLDSLACSMHTCVPELMRLISSNAHWCRMHMACAAMQPMMQTHPQSLALKAWCRLQQRQQHCNQWLNHAPPLQPNNTHVATFHKPILRTAERAALSSGDCWQYTSHVYVYTAYNEYQVSTPSQGTTQCIQNVDRLPQATTLRCVG